MFSLLDCLRRLQNKAVTLFLLVIVLSFILASCANRLQLATNITVDFSSPIGTSQFSPGITLVDNTLNYPWGNNDLAAVNNVKSLIRQGISYENTPIMAWGVDDPWPDPSQAEPSNWSSLDNRLHLILSTGGIPVITLSEAPWWMKGQLEPDGTTRLIAQSEEWSDVAYAARILDNKMDAWLHLVQRVAERYMVAPYNVRYFQVWNELKGYYNPLTNAYDYTTSPGDSGGPNARHGYTYMYNLVYSRLMQVARSLGIPTKDIKVGGPYIVIDTWSSRDQSDPSNITKAYGTYDQRSLDVVQYWLQHKTGAGFIALDSSNGNKDTIALTDPFTASEKFADVTRWIRTLNTTTYPGAATLPIWWAEWYASPYTQHIDNQYDNAVKSYAMIELLKAGGAVPLSWGSPGNAPSSAGLWTTTAAKGGGQPSPWYASYKAFRDDFAPGTPIYKTVVSLPAQVEALASATHIMLVNKTPQRLVISVDGTPVLLNPYQVSVIPV